MARRKDPPGKMTRVADGIYRRNGGYVVRVYNPVTKGRENFPADTIEEAREIKRREEANKKARGRAVRQTVEVWAPRFTAGAGEANPRSESTRKHNAERIKPFVADFADRELESITKQEAHLWIKGGTAPPELEDVARTWAGAEEHDGVVTVPAHRSNLAAVRAMFGDAKRVDLIADNPFGGMGLQQSRGRSDIDVIQPDELEALVRIAGEEHGVYGRYVFAPMIVAAAWTGLRPGELFALRPEDVELDRRVTRNGQGIRVVRPGDRGYEDAEPAPVLHVRRALNAKTGETGDTKNHERRTVALLPEAEKALRQLLEQGLPPDEPIFRTTHGKPYMQRHHHYYWDPVRRAFRNSRPEGHWLHERVAEKGRTGELDFYELRHHFGTRLAEAGLSPYDIAKMMGHRDGGKLAMERYIHTDRDMAIERTLQAFRRVA